MANELERRIHNKEITRNWLSSLGKSMLAYSIDVLTSDKCPDFHNAKSTLIVLTRNGAKFSEEEIQKNYYPRECQRVFRLKMPNKYDTKRKNSDFNRILYS